MRLDRPLVKIRSREVLEVFDLALVVLRRRPAAIAATALAGIAPFLALNQALAMAWGPMIWWWPLAVALEAPLATAPLTVLLGGLMFGERPRAGRIAAELTRGAVPLVLYAGLVRGAVLATVVLLPFLSDRLAYLDEVILLERSRWGRVLERGKALARGAGGESLARGTLQLGFATVLALMCWWALPKLAESLTDRWTPAPPTGPLALASLQLGVWAAVAFFGVVRFLGYIDQRIKSEGWEVELRLRAAGALMEDERRW